MLPEKSIGPAGSQSANKRHPSSTVNRQDRTARSARVRLVDPTIRLTYLAKMQFLY
jgi:hypothetical protein